MSENLGDKSHKELQALLEWAREGQNPFLESAVIVELTRRIPPVVVYTKERMDRYNKGLNLCPHCRKPYLRQEDEKYIHADYGEGAMMYHTMHPIAL